MKKIVGVVFGALLALSGSVISAENEPTPEQYLNILIQLAEEEGDAQIQLMIAEIYRTGDGINPNPVKAHEWYSKAAMQGDPRGETVVGLNYFFGQGVSVDGVKAEEWLVKAAKHQPENTIPQRVLASMYYNGTGIPVDYNKALHYGLQSAENGDAMSQRIVGIIYLSGSGVPVDYTESLRWFMKAAEQDDADSQRRVGLMHYKGLGVPVDYSEAFSWLSKSAKLNDHHAQVVLGIMYEQGQGTLVDYVEAYSWYNISAAHGSKGSEDTREIMDALTKKMTPEQIAEAQKLSRQRWQAMQK